MSQKVIHTIAPVYDSNSRVLLLGTIPSPKSRETGFYYGHPQNRFWKVLAAVFDEEIPDTILKKQQLLKQHRVALWDVLHACSIAGAEDASIREPESNDLRPLLKAAPIQAVFCTGQKAAALYRKHLLPQTHIPAVALPSTSPANCAKSLEQLIKAYQQILPYLEERA
ncbi:MAG: DNA-deoxyinosine glycosylase [Anaerotruncus sp.]|nr:DNA-deoxyinosine glycosylase [Anaerotruncus sp.]